MPTGPNGEKRPADSNANAVLVAKMATGEIPKDSPIITEPPKEDGGGTGTRTPQDGT